MSAVVLLFKTPENFVLSGSRSKRRTKLYTLRKIGFVNAQLMHLPNLYTTPKGHLIKFRTFFEKNNSYLEKYKFAWRLVGLKLEHIS